MPSSPIRHRLTRVAVAVAVCGALVGIPAAVGAAEPGASAGLAAAAARTYPATIADARAAARKLLADSGASSLSVSFVDGARVAWHETFGVVDASGTKPAEATMYGLGSVSKTVLAVAVMRLVDAGKVSLDAPVVRYVTDFSMASPEYRRITVRMLLDHSAGLPGSDYANAMTTAPYDGYQEQLLRGLRTERLKTTPGAMSVYCNDCFTLAEIVVQRVAGRPYTDYVTDEILTPLGMTHSRYATEAFPAGSYAPVLTPDGPLPQEFLSLPGSGGLYSTPVDMSRLAAMLMNGGVYGGRRILSAASVAEMSRDQTVTTLDPVKDNEFKYGLGWDSVREPGLAAVGIPAWVKGGDSIDYHAGFTVAPSARLATVIQIAGTTASSSQAQTLGQRIILRALVERGDLKAMPKPLGAVTLPARTPSAAQLAAIEGVYLAGGGAFRIGAGPRGSVTFSRLTDGAWVSSPTTFALLSDGRFWDTKTRMKALSTVSGWGRHYLVLRQAGGNGHYRTDVVLGERLDPAGTLSAAWQARIGRSWVLANEVAVSLNWSSPSMTLREVPDLPGYVYADIPGNPQTVDPATSDTLGAMTVVIPAMQGRDLDDVAVLVRGGEEWLRMGSTLRRPVDGIPSAAKGASTLAIDADGNAGWLRFPTAGSVTTVGADAWKAFDASFALVASGGGDAKAVTVESGGFLVLFGAPAKVIAVDEE